MTQAELNYNAGASHRAEVRQEINANKIFLNRNTFVKSAQERKDLAKAKFKFRKSGGLFEWNERNRPGNNLKVTA